MKKVFQLLFMVLFMVFLTACSMESPISDKEVRRMKE